MKTSTATRRLAGAAVVAATAVAVAALAPAAGAAPNHERHQLAGSRPGWTARAKAVGTTAGSSSVSFGVVLGMRNASGVAAEIQKLSDPSSADYGKWLTNSQFDATYAPTADSVHAVQGWLRSQGFAVGTTLPSGMLIEASGTADRVEQTFGTSLKQYSYQGKTVRANTTALSLPTDTPASVVSAVSGVIGVDQGSTLKSPTDTLPGPPAGARYGVQPCSQYFGQDVATDKPPAYGKQAPYAVCGYGPQQLQSAYGIDQYLRRGVDGRGVTVAITDAYAAPTILADAQKYSQVHDQPQFKHGQFSQILPAADSYDEIDDCGGNGWYGEETLDVESVHAMAPGANIVYVGGQDCGSGLDNAWASTIDNHVADIVTNSWADNGYDTIDGLGQDYVDFYQQFSEEAALTGITVNFSLGDAGDNTAGGTQPAAKSVNFPGDLPYVTGVGGTSVAIGRNGQREGEWGWSNAYSPLTDGAWNPAPPGAYSSGTNGGTSQLFTQPWYQRDVVPTAISTYYGSTPMRAVPDISMPGDPNTGFEVGETQTFSDGTYWDQYRIGGDSLASPLEAGALAIADQLGHRSLGFVNPLYYLLSRTSAIRDILPPQQPVTQVRTNYTNGVDGTAGKSYLLETIDYEGTTLHVTKGWDDMTGVGTPGGPQFYAALAVLGHFRKR